MTGLNDRQLGSARIHSRSYGPEFAHGEFPETVHKPDARYTRGRFQYDCGAVKKVLRPDDSPASIQLQLTVSFAGLQVAAGFTTSWHGGTPIGRKRFHLSFVPMKQGTIASGSFTFLKRRTGFVL